MANERQNYLFKLLSLIFQLATIGLSWSNFDNCLFEYLLVIGQQPYKRLCIWSDGGETLPSNHFATKKKRKKKKNHQFVFFIDLKRKNGDIYFQLKKFQRKSFFSAAVLCFSVHLEWLIQQAAKANEFYWWLKFECITQLFKYINLRESFGSVAFTFFLFRMDLKPWPLDHWLSCPTLKPSQLPSPKSRLMSHCYGDVASKSTIMLSVIRRLILLGEIKAGRCQLPKQT